MSIYLSDENKKLKKLAGRLNRLDSALNLESTNPVQNKVITSALNEVNKLINSIPETVLKTHYTKSETDDKITNNVNVKFAERERQKSNGKNLLQATVFKNGWVDGSGRFNASNTCSMVANLIKVEPNTEYTYSVNITMNYLSIAGYDENGVFVELIHNLERRSAITFTTGNNIHYLTVTAELAYGTNFPADGIMSYEPQIEVGNVRTAYQPYSGPITHSGDASVIFAENERQKTLNMFNVNTITRGYSLSSATGANTSDSLWYVSDYINVQGLSAVIISGFRDSGQSNCFYDANKTFISTYKAIKGYIPVPSNAVYMRINGIQSQLGDGYTIITQGDMVHNNIIQGMNGVVLWENPNKKAAFAAQTVTLSNSLSYFDYCALEYEAVVPNNEVYNCRQYAYFRPIVGGNVENLTGGWDSGTRYIKARSLTIVSETQVKFLNAFQEGTNDNRMMVPLRIIGYKKGV
jgi:hypothetical protein